MPGRTRLPNLDTPSGLLADQRPLVPPWIVTRRYAFSQTSIAACATGCPVRTIQDDRGNAVLINSASGMITARPSTLSVGAASPAHAHAPNLIMTRRKVASCAG